MCICVSVSVNVCVYTFIHTRARTHTPHTHMYAYRYCPWHSCCVCDRKSSAAGGMLFHCEACPTAYCFDCCPEQYKSQPSQVCVCVHTHTQTHTHTHTVYTHTHTHRANTTRTWRRSWRETAWLIHSLGNHFSKVLYTVTSVVNMSGH